MARDNNYQGRHWAPRRPAWMTRHLTAAGAATVIVALVAVSGLGALSAPPRSTGTPQSLDPADYPPPAVLLETPRNLGPLIPTQAPPSEPVVLVANEIEDIALLQSQVAELSRQLAAAVTRAQVAETALAGVQGQVTTLQAQLDALNTMVGTMEDLIEALEARILVLETPPAPPVPATPTATPTP